MRNVLITGACGFIGSNLVKHFAEAGEHVVALDRAVADPLLRAYLGPAIDRVSFVGADISDRCWHEALPGATIDLAVHAAAVTNVADGEEIGRAVDAVAVNIGGTANFVAWALSARPSRVIHISSSAVYGSILDGGAPIDETQPTLPANLYGITKLAAEQVAFQLARLSGLPLVAARLVGPFGPMERPSADRTRLSPVHAWCDAAARGEELIVHDGYLPRDYLYVADTAAAVHRLATTRTLHHDVYNVSAGIAVASRDFIAALRQVVPTLRWSAVDAPAVNLISRSISNARLIGDTGWHPRYDLRGALAEYVAWLRETRPGTP
jgi:nucleoside-diphosphate-sugar epimerase